MTQRFGMFEWPDFFEFHDGHAFCVDCGAAAEKSPLRGSFKLNTAFTDSPIPAVEGDLINKCGNHHFEMHPGTKGTPQHNVFRIDIGNRTIGETNPVSSMATGSVVFNLTDQKLAKEFSLKQRELTDAFERFWRK